MQTLSTAERFFVAAAEAGQGQGFALAVLFEGGVERHRLDRAWRILQDRYPIARSRLVERRLFRDGWSGFAWKEAEEGANPIRWIDLDPTRASDEAGFREAVFGQLETWGNSDLKIREEAPLQLLVLTAPAGRFALLYHSHHTAMDGVGFVQITRDLMEIHNELHEGRRPTRAAPKALGRGLVRFLRAPGFLGLLAALGAGWKLRRLNRPRRNDPLPVSWTERSSRMGAAQMLFGGDDLKVIRGACKSRSMSLNEAFLCAVVRTVARFAAERGARLKKITLAMPVNLRPYLRLDPRETISNQAITVNIYIPARAVEDPAKLLAVIRDQSTRMKKTALPIVYVLKTMFLGIFTVRMLARAFRSVVASPRPSRTAPTLVVSNVGNIWLAPDGSTLDNLGTARITGLLHIYQCGYPIPGTVALYTFRHELHMEMSFATGAWNREVAKGFLAGVRTSLYDLLGLTGAAGNGSCWSDRARSGRRDQADFSSGQSSA